MAKIPGLDAGQQLDRLNKAAANAIRGRQTSIVSSHFFKLNADELEKKSGRTLISNDLMFRFPKLFSNDFRQSYGYDLIIYDADRGDRILTKLQFPINPSNISISVPHATSLTVTMKGIVEDMNGAPLHMIRLSGSTGVAHAWPTEPGTQKSAKSKLGATLEYAFKNTIKAANNVGRQVQKVKSAFQGQTQKDSDLLNFVPSANQIAETQEYPVYTGFSFAHNLMRFLDMYMSMKKNRENKGLRLMLSMHKDGGFYTCTLNNYSMTKAAGTLEYNYSIDLTSWRKHSESIGNLDNAFKVPAKQFANTKNQINKMANVLNTIRQARVAVASVHNVLRGIRGDINDSFIQPCAEIGLFLKDSIGLTRTIFDFCFRSGILNEVKEAWKQQVIENFDQATAEYGKLIETIQSRQGGFSAVSLKQSLTDKIESGRPDAFGKLGDSADPVDDLFKNAADHPELLDEVSMDGLALSAEASKLIDDEMDRIRQLNSDDIRKRRDQIANFAASVSDAFGGTSATYNRINDVSSAHTSIKKLSVADIEIISNLNDIVMSLDTLITELDDSQAGSAEDYYSFYVDYAVANGLALSTANVSKFFVPFQTGGSLESLALQYLGDPDRWPEIAALNALRSPYVDEKGFDVTVTGSGGGNTLNVSDVSNLFIGQVVDISSTTQLTIKRKIRSIDVFSSAEAIITFEVANDNVLLTSYKQSEGAKITAHLPGTVNSNMLIAIPSETPSNVDSSLKTTPGVDEMNGLARIAKIDFLLDTQGDLIFTSAGDLQLATGLTNLVQAAKLKLLTKLSTMIQHPEFGNPVETGSSTAEIDTATSLEGLRTLFAEDPRFSGILAAEFNKLGPSMTIAILLGIANSDTVLPISVQAPL
jgi:hypothetical protein